MRRHPRFALAAAGLALLAPAAAGAAARPFAYHRAPYSAHPSFAVTYRGSGVWRTDYHATPPNAGGAPDANEAHDSSVQWWRLAFDDALTPGDGDLEGAHGRTLVVGHVRHTHVDGLYTQLDAEVSCTVKGATGRATPIVTTLAVQRAGGGLRLTAANPLVTVLANMPGACPGQGDSLDRILDNYFTPGFSFDPPHSPDRWLTSGPVAIPANVLHRASRIAVALGPAADNRPPPDCAVLEPSYEQCLATGGWTGVLTLRRRG